MSMTAMERAAYRVFRGPATWQHATFHQDLDRRLRRAAMPQDPVVYLSYLDLIALVTLVEGCVLAFLAVAVLPGAGFAMPLPGIILAALAPILLPMLVYLVGLARPEVRAGDRAAAIDLQLPHALNYMAAMGSSGMTPDRILASLGRQSVYGEVAREARAIAAEVRWTGKDLLSALRDAVPRSPSTKLQDIWQGMHATIGSGASLKTYLLGKAEQMHRDNASLQRRSLDNLGVLAESFMVVAVAAPVFMIIMLTVMGAAGPGGAATMPILWLLVVVMIPGAQFGFALAVHSMRRRV